MLNKGIQTLGLGNNTNSIATNVDLSAPGVAKGVANQVLRDIDSFCQDKYDDGHRTHLGASLIGRSCSRYLWYVFRWVLKEPFSGQQQRLFNRGHKEEARFIEWLQGIGFKLWFEDESQPRGEDGQFPQYRISDVMGHFGGSLDGIGLFPERYGITEPVLVEFKTSGDTPFQKLKQGMPLAKPEHFAQTSTYGYKYNFRYVLYLNINKNTDHIHIEIAQLNHNLGRQMVAKAERIILSQTPPPKLSEQATFKDCTYCAMKGICHQGAIPERNCRSCRFAVPTNDKQWGCTGYNSIIPKDVIPVGCHNYQAITRNLISRHG